MVTETRLLWQADSVQEASLRGFPPSRWLLTLSLSLCLLLASQTAPATGDEVNRESTLYRQLLTPITSLIDGKPFRDAVERVAQQTGLNLCLDRRVDPTAPVFPGELGPTVYSALKKIAAERNCVIMPVAGVLLVGRPEWVDATADVLITMTGPRERDSVTVSWQDLTTPNEVLALVSGENPPAMDLPHDLWPQTTWHRIDRNVASALVLAQFDRRPTSAGANGGSVAESTGVCTRRYRAGEYGATLRQSFARTVGTYQVRTLRDVLEVQAPVAAHRLATDAWLDRMVAELPAKPTDAGVFSLKLKERAGAAIKAFAAKSGRRCSIDPDALQACEAIVTLEANEKSLRELAEMVAREAKLVIRWTEDTVIVSKAD